MKNIGDLQRMAREMQANMEKAQTELGQMTVDGRRHSDAAAAEE